MVTSVSVSASLASVGRICTWFSLDFRVRRNPRSPDTHDEHPKLPNGNIKAQKHVREAKEASPIASCALRKDYNGTVGLQPDGFQAGEFGFLRIFSWYASCGC